MSKGSSSEVVARGQRWNELQFPSPLYFSHWVDDSHVLVGAGGGGKRFGMANVAAVFQVDTTAGLIHSNSNNAGPAGAPGNNGSKPEELLWSFCCAVDLGGDIPWCSSGFVKFDEAAHGRFTSAAEKRKGNSSSVATLGLVAISHVDSFSVVALRRDLRTMDLFLERVVRQPVTFDEADPDKKPIAFTQECIVVSQDDKSIAFFALIDLVPLGQAALNDEKDDDDEHNSSSSVALSRPTSAPRPTSSIALPARVNDLSAVSLPNQPTTECQPRILVAASVQDKLLHLIVAPSTGGKCSTAATSLSRPVDVAQLSAGEMHFPRDISFTKSALRSITLSPRTFHLLLIVNHALSGYTYVTDGKVDVDVIEMLSAGSGAAEKQLSPAVPVVAFAPTPTRLVKDGVTCYAPVPSSLSLAQVQTTGAITVQKPCSPVAGTPVARKDEGGSTLPIPSGLAEHWMMGTVDGKVLLVRYSCNLHDTEMPRFVVLMQRPAGNGSSSVRRGSEWDQQLHREPISSIAVSNRNDVITTDIAQKVVISALPLVQQLRGGAAKGSAVPNAIVRSKNTKLYVFPRMQLGASAGLFSLNCIFLVVALLFAAATSAFFMSLNPTFSLNQPSTY